MCARRKDGGLKRSGLRQGDRRVGRTLRFKLQVVDEYRWLQRRKAEGECGAPVRETAARFGVHKSLVCKWAAQEAALRRAVACDAMAVPRSPSTPSPASPPPSPASPQASPPPATAAPSSSTDSEPPPSSPPPIPSPPTRPSCPSVRRAAAERSSLHPGSKCRFPRAEAEAHQVYRRRRERGLRVTARTLRVCMRRAIRKHHGAEAAAAFRASDRWLQAFARRHGVRLRRKTNAKHLSVAARLAQCQRWHARFRRRLRRGSAPSGRSAPLQPIATQRLVSRLVQ